MLSIESHDNGSRNDEWPIKEGGKLPWLKIFASPQVVRLVCLFVCLWWFLFFSLTPAHAHFFIHNSLYSTTSDSRWWPNAHRHKLWWRGFFFFSSIFTSVGWIMRPRCKTGLRQKTEIQACCPVLGYPPENCTNGIITCTGADYLKHNLPERYRSARQHVHYTAAQNAENVRAVASHRPGRDGNNW